MAVLFLVLADDAVSANPRSPSLRLRDRRPAEARAAARGSRRDRPRLRQPRHPSPAIAVEKLAEAAAEAGQPPLLGEPRAAEPPRGRLRALREPASASPSTPTCTSSSTIGAKEGLAHLMWVLLEGGDSAVVPSPSYPIHLVAPRLAGATVVARAHRRRRRLLRGDRGGDPRRAARAARRDRLVPAQPDHRDRDARADAAARRPGARARVRARPRLRLRGHRLRRPRAAVACSRPRARSTARSSSTA